MTCVQTSTRQRLPKPGVVPHGPPDHRECPYRGALKVSIFTALYLDNYWVRNEKTSDLDVGRRPELKSEAFAFRPLYLLR